MHGLANFKLLFFIPFRNSPSGPRRPHYRGSMIIFSYLVHTTHSLWLLWTSYHPDAETSTWQHTTQNRQTSMPSALFEPPVSASEQLQPHTLYRTTTGIECCFSNYNFVATFWIIAYAPLAVTCQLNSTLCDPWNWNTRIIA